MSGCIAKSSEVDGNKIAITDLAKVVKANHPEDKNIDSVVKNAFANEMRQSGILGKEQVGAMIKAATAGAGKLFGFDLSGVVGGILGLLGLGGAGVAGAGAIKRRRQMNMLAELPPAEARKMKELI